MDIETITKAFDLMGRYLRERNTIGEIAVYGGSAILLQFPWRKSTEDVEATFGKPEASVKDAAAFAAIELRLPDAWLNNSVGSFTPEVEEEDFFVLFGDYPRGEKSGLRVCLAKPEYLIAMKLKALVRDSYDDKDFGDIAGPAVEARIETAAQLNDLFASFFPEEKLDPVAAARIPEAVEAIRARKPR
ncbi:MAG TPA: hypothetical protein VK804_31695 [Bradyrhizobium sp.]|nr:hypothetical protein [Bradyrhizobium sp.]